MIGAGFRKYGHVRSGPCHFPLTTASLSPRTRPAGTPALRIGRTGLRAGHSAPWQIRHRPYEHGHLVLPLGTRGISIITHVKPIANAKICLFRSGSKLERLWLCLTLWMEIT